MDLIISSLTLQANLFQLFQPMGGVRATPLSQAWAAGGNESAQRAMRSIVLKNFANFIATSGELRRNHTGFTWTTRTGFEPKTQVPNIGTWGTRNRGRKSRFIAKPAMGRRSSGSNRPRNDNDACGCWQGRELGLRGQFIFWQNDKG